jgi:signal transduction histidine kinase
MVSSISHGIKGILTGLDGGLYLLSSGISKNEPGKTTEGLEVVRQMVDRIRDMVLNILYYAKDRALDWKRIDVSQFTEDLVATVKSRLQNKPIEFEQIISTSLGDFEVDAEVAGTALTNIIENAIEACTEDPSGRSHRIIFGVNQDKENIIFDIRDNGIGMNDEIRNNIFNLFYSSKGKKGTGLGLFITRNIIQQHGGSIEVDSTVGQGTRFRVIMPKLLPQEAKQNEN